MLCGSMALAAGTKLGQYEIRGLIGKGGMGEVYRAFDTKLERDVALKLLPEMFARDPERVARFKREAKLLASLNHPNIAAIHGIEEANGAHFLVMEMVEGETLAEQVRRGPVEIDEALRISTQIAEALEHAHEKTVIHRDLKPANVKVTPEGTVKVLDFGLAKAFAGAASGADSPTPLIDSNSSTLSRMPEGLAQPDASPTLPGVILGTAAYMSPEQAKGKTVDKRTDIWALGCVLYELLTGKQVFTGDGATEILGAIHHKEPDWSLLPDATPPGIRTLLRRCLQKEAKKRYHAAADVNIAIEDAASAVAPVPAPAAPGNKLRERLAWGVAGVAVVTALSLAFLHFRPASNPGSVTRFTITLPSNERLVAADYCQAIALSPEGTHLAYVTNEPGGVQRLRLRVLDSLEVQSVPGIYRAVDSLFFSPDGQWLGFWADNTLRKVSISGGTPVTLATAGVCGASWGSNDTIVFGSNKGLEEVSASGGPTKLLAAADPKKGERGYMFPQLLPGGKAVLFTVVNGPPDRRIEENDFQTVVQSLETGERRTIIQGAGAARYVSTGYLVYPLAGRLLAAPFDLAGLEIRGKADSVLEGIIPRSGAFSVSRVGSLVYIPGPVEGSGRTLVWVDRQGKAQPFGAPARDYAEPKLSPNGQRLAVTIHGDIWVYDIARGTLTRLTFEGSKTRPLWSHDGSRIAFGTLKEGAMNLSWIAADGSGGEELLATSENPPLPMSWSPDGLWLAYVQTTPTTKSDLWILPLQGDPRQAGAGRKPRLFLQTPFSDAAARFSPDGHWLVYHSDESGQYEVYARPFPGPGGKIQISTEGGRAPLWPRNGRELFYLNADKMMVVDVQTQPTLRPGTPRLLFKEWYENDPGNRSYDVTLDGERFLMLQASEQVSAATQINVVLNWFEELKAKVPVK